MSATDENIGRAVTTHLERLANEATSLAGMLRQLQDHLALVPDDHFPIELRASGQILDSGEQGLNDFAAVFQSLANAPIPLSQDALRTAFSKTQQHKLRLCESGKVSSQDDHLDAGDQEIF